MALCFLPLEFHGLSDVSLSFSFSFSCTLSVSKLDQTLFCLPVLVGGLGDDDLLTVTVLRSPKPAVNKFPSMDVVRAPLLSRDRKSDLGVVLVELCSYI